MADDIIERRGYKRAFISDYDNISATLKLSDQHDDFLSTKVMDIGEGGAGFIITKDQGEKIQPDRKLMIQKIAGSGRLGFLTGLEMEIRWVVNNDRLQHIGFGCEFAKLPWLIREKIRKYVQAWIAGF